MLCNEFIPLLDFLAGSVAGDLGDDESTSFGHPLTQDSSNGLRQMLGLLSTFDVAFILGGGGRESDTGNTSVIDPVEIFEVVISSKASILCFSVCILI